MIYYTTINNHIIIIQISKLHDQPKHNRRRAPAPVSQWAKAKQHNGGSQKTSTQNIK